MAITHLKRKSATLLSAGPDTLPDSPPAEITSERYSRLLELLDERLRVLEVTRPEALNDRPREDAGNIERGCTLMQLCEIHDALEALGVSPGAMAGLGRLMQWLQELDDGSSLPPIFTPVRPSSRPPLSKTRLQARGWVAGHIFAEEKRLRADGMTAAQASREAARRALADMSPHLRRVVADDDLDWRTILKWRRQYAGPNADPHAKAGFVGAGQMLEDGDFDARDGINIV